jgi:hypothetical protein
MEDTPETVLVNEFLEENNIKYIRLFLDTCLNGDNEFYKDYPALSTDIQAYVNFRSIHGPVFSPTG